MEPVIASPRRNPAAELAGHLLLATARAEKAAAALPAEARGDVDRLLASLEEAIDLAYQLAPAVRRAHVEGSRLGA